MPVVLGPGWPGVLLQRGRRHGLEADFNRKKTSAFAGLIRPKSGQRKVTVVDNGRMPNAAAPSMWTTRAIHAGDRPHRERNPPRYLSDKLSSRLMGAPNTRLGPPRELPTTSPCAHDQHLHASGTDQPEDIIKSVQRGLYASTSGGGQVDITKRQICLSASEAYLIEEGASRSPSRRDADRQAAPRPSNSSHGGQRSRPRRSIGTCGKNGQSVPVGVGMPPQS